jgi:hypothetical protein
MSVIPLTVFFSLLLAGLFIGLFAHEQRRRRFASAERDSLLPLADEIPRVVPDGVGIPAALAARSSAPAGAVGETPDPESIYF